MENPLNRLLINTPATQLPRVTLIRTAFSEARYADAVYSLIMAARETRGSAWSEQCEKLAEQVLQSIELGGEPEQREFIAALLDLYGKRLSRDRIDIDAAVILATTHLSCGSSAAGALSEGYKLLKQAGLGIPPDTSARHSPG